MTDKVKAIAETVAADIKAFRSAAVTSENKSDVSARSMLAALVSGLWTQGLAESAIIHAFGNPKSPATGKPVIKLSGLRAFSGGDAVRKAAETCFRIFANIDADKPVNVPATVEGEADAVIGAGAIRPLVVAYILNEADAPKSLRALNEAVATALRKHAKAISPDNADAKAETDAESEASANAVDAPFNISDAIAKLTVFAANMSADDADMYSEALNALYAVWDERCNVLTGPAELAQAA